MKNNIKKSTMVDVANEASVSVATVSHVINKTRHVNVKTSEKVLNAIDKLNYSVNFNARSLKGKSSKLVGLIIPDMANPVMSKLGRGLEKVFNAENYNIIICDTEGDWNKEKDYIDMLKSRSIDCIIIMPSSNRYLHLKQAISEGISIIVIEREIKNFICDTILLNSDEIAYDAVKYLIKMGHKKIGFLKRPFDLSHSIKRFRGYCKALKENKIKVNKDFCPRCNSFRFSGGYYAMNKILALSDKPTAIMAFNDISAIGAIKAIKDKGYKIPGDFSIIGFDDILIDKYIDPSLSSTSFPVEAISKNVIKIFEENLNNKKKNPKKIIIKSTLKIRDSIRTIL